MATRCTRVISRQIQHPRLPMCIEQVSLNYRDENMADDTWDYLSFHLADATSGKCLFQYPENGMMSRQTYLQQDYSSFFRDTRYGWWKPASEATLSQLVTSPSLLQRRRQDQVMVVIKATDDLYLFSLRPFVDSAGKPLPEGGKLELFSLPAMANENPHELASYIIKTRLNVRMVTREDVDHLIYLPDKASFSYVLAMNDTLLGDDSFSLRNMRAAIKEEPLVHLGVPDILEALHQNAFAKDTQAVLASFLNSPDWLRMKTFSHFLQ